jgi:pSer/pThr/pTyr-binding forkhead associated (FHA) protein
MDDLSQPADVGEPALVEYQAEAGNAPAVCAPMRLVLHPGGCSVDIRNTETVVGRHSTSDLRLHLPDVSRRHCRLAYLNGAWNVFDLGSLNGVFVNDVKVQEAILHHQDLLRIGSYTFEVQLETGVTTIPLGVHTRCADQLSESDHTPKRQAS